MAIAPLAFTPSAWTNQLLPLYHGTLDIRVPSILAGVNVHHGRAHTDFGQGFYTTTVERQAHAWAWQRCSASGSSAAVSMPTTSGAWFFTAAQEEASTR